MTVNMWGTDPDLIDADEFCPDCEHDVRPQADGTTHYDGCPRLRRRVTVPDHSDDEGGYGQGFTTALILAAAPRKD